MLLKSPTKLVVTYHIRVDLTLHLQVTTCTRTEVLPYSVLYPYMADDITACYDCRSAARSARFASAPCICAERDEAGVDLEESHPSVIPAT